MSSMANFYTAGGNLEQMTIYSVTSAVDGYPKERLLDQNLDTTWRPTETSAGMDAQDIIIDAGQDITVDVYVLWVQNYKTNFGSGTFDLYYSDTGTGGPWTNTNNSHLILDIVNPVRVRGLSSSLTKRYWKLAIPALDATIHLSGLWLCRLFELDQAQTYPDEDTFQYHNVFRIAPGGRIFTRAINRNPIRILPRTYKITDSAKRDVIQDMFNDTRGRRCPLFLQEQTGQGYVRFVYLMTDRLEQAKVDYQLWTISLPFQEIPFVDDGDTY